MSQPPRDQPDDAQDVVPGAPMPAYERGDGGIAATAGTGATVAFVLGILSVVGMPFFGPVAWILGRRAVHAADETAGSNRGVAFAGMVLGIVGTVMLIVVVFAVVAFVVLVAAGARTP